MKSREEIDAETVGEPRVRKKKEAKKTDEKCFRDACKSRLGGRRNQDNTRLGSPTLGWEWPLGQI